MTEITISAPEFRELRALSIDYPIDPWNDMASLGAMEYHLEVLSRIIGAERVRSAMLTGEEVRIRVDWSDRNKKPPRFPETAC